MIKLSRVLASSVVAALLIAVPSAAATGRGGSAPLAVKTASLSQDGQDLAWHLVLDQRFSPAGLAHDGRSICLLFERVRNAGVDGEVCLTGGVGRHAAPRLEYRPVTSAGVGRPRVIAGTVSRPSADAVSAVFLPGSVGLSYVPLRWQVMSTLRPPACAPPAPGGAACLQLFPGRPALARLHTPQLVGCQPAGSPFVYHGPTDRPEVALTFDDGPWPDTPQILKILEREHANATFFEVGDEIGTYGQGGAIERRMLADGDMIGDHTWNHADVAGAGPFAAAEIRRAAAAIRRATDGFEPCLFRTPYGAGGPALVAEARSLGFTTIQWNVDPRDWARPGVSAIVGNVVANARSGSIVIEHDGGGDRSETVAALPLEIAALRREGYRLITVTELLGQQLIYK